MLSSSGFGMVSLPSFLVLDSRSGVMQALLGSVALELAPTHKTVPPLRARKVRPSDYAATH